MSHCFFDRALDLAQNARPDSATRHPTFDRPYRYGSGYVVNIEICPGVAFRHHPGHGGCQTGLSASTGQQLPVHR